MKERRKRIMKRLLVEELERREMLTGSAGLDALSSTSLQLAGPSSSTTDDDTPRADSFAPDATSGVGQQTITTGANTPGIGSFATPTAGPSRAGGTGNPNSPLGSNLAAADAALEELYGDSDKAEAAKADSDAAPADAAQRTTSERIIIGSKPTARRAWNIDPDEADAEQASPVGAGAER
jgi:hypothetical protein